jgi:hypothetical protein
MTGVLQDREHHAEGDVETHTRMACEALVAQESWRALLAPERVRMFTTVLMHDVANPTAPYPPGANTSPPSSATTKQRTANGATLRGEPLK